MLRMFFPVSLSASLLSNYLCSRAGYELASGCLRIQRSICGWHLARNRGRQLVSTSRSYGGVGPDHEAVWHGRWRRIPNVSIFAKTSTLLLQALGLADMSPIRKKVVGVAKKSPQKRRSTGLMIADQDPRVDGGDEDKDEVTSVEKTFSTLFTMAVVPR